LQLAPGLRMKPLELKITPKMKKITDIDLGSHISRTVEYMTDNATYQPANHSITFLPHSHQAKLEGFHVNFWEVPLIAAHEFGHHVFQSLFTHYPTTTGISHCFDHVGSSTQQHLKSSHLSERKVGQLQVLSALHEGFADLIAFYALDAEEASFREVRCLQISRDVKEPSFYDNKLKIFSPQVVEEFFSGTNSSPRGCQFTNFQHSHSIGAIFAHQADKFLSQFTENKDLKLQTLLEWARELNRQYPRMRSLTPRDYMREAFVIFLQFSVDKFKTKFDRDLCVQADRFYHGISQQLAECNLI
jgi:hypothetical protein